MSSSYLEIRRERLRSHISFLYWEDIARSVRHLEKLRLKQSQLLSNLAFLQRCRDKEVVPKFAVVKHHIRSAAVNRILRKTSHAIVKERIRHTRYELDMNARLLFSCHLFLAEVLSPLDWEWVDMTLAAHQRANLSRTTAKQADKFERLNRDQGTTGSNGIHRTVINFSDKELDEATISALSKGLNFAPAPPYDPL
ncbi:uncharacterized protein LOC124606320 [Schistocerca americana]|uniref:uncharacterized protein LOC124606320 n=1 Tax=Schistocerca americana TaxID=7009 RepID=UPI001F4F9A2F|nr:uncharacterized protein LOC124606320 [Schistocerca americana]